MQYIFMETNKNKNMESPEKTTLSDIEGKYQ